jgi:hypothetical protein
MGINHKDNFIIAVGGAGMRGEVVEGGILRVEELYL